MPRFEYKVIPAPKKGQRGKGVRGTEGKFANALQALMNEHGAQGWEYQRTDTLPCEERSGLTGKTTVFQNVLVFRRALEEDVETPEATTSEPVETFATKRVELEETAKPDDGPLIKDAEARETPVLGGATKSDPGKTAPVPEVVAQ